MYGSGGLNCLPNVMWPPTYPRVSSPLTSSPESVLSTDGIAVAGVYVLEREGERERCSVGQIPTYTCIIYM